MGGSESTLRAVYIFKEYSESAKINICRSNIYILSFSDLFILIKFDYFLHYNAESELCRKRLLRIACGFLCLSLLIGCCRKHPNTVTQCIHHYVLPNGWLQQSKAQHLVSCAQSYCWNLCPNGSRGLGCMWLLRLYFMPTVACFQVRSFLSVLSLGCCSDNYHWKAYI